MAAAMDAGKGLRGSVLDLSDKTQKIYFHLEQKFNCADFIFWKKQVYIFVQVHKLDGILNGTIECPVQLLDDNNAPTLNEEGRPTQEAAILAWHDLDLQAQDLIFSTTETGGLILSLLISWYHFPNKNVLKMYFPNT
ncbi:hypothetical protein OUZ56_005667 [Daphnia magna]|uniref:Uncharacterized protein n=1 Tax=Daphnia magna TaxID=35525 RepID=A0ABQ9YU42_9CRUS|nr:hypothetical protein OUZ56_005667 [Daphnia magna]